MYFIKLYSKTTNNILAQKLTLPESPLFVKVKSKLLDNNVPLIRRPQPISISGTLSFQDKITLDLPPDTQSNLLFSTYLATSYPNFTVLYTDGSKRTSDTTSVAAGFYIPCKNKIFTYKLHPNLSVLASELLAVKKLFVTFMTLYPKAESYTQIPKQAYKNYSTKQWLQLNHKLYERLSTIIKHSHHICSPPLCKSSCRHFWQWYSSHGCKPWIFQ